MRMSASGLESTIAVAIDQILRLAPSIRPPIDPVVSSTNATSTVGLATAPENAAVDSNAAVARASTRVAIADFIGILQCSVPRNQNSPASSSREVENKADAVRICALFGAVAALFLALKSARVCRNGIASPKHGSGAAAGPPSVGDGARDRARHRTAAALAGFFLHQRVAAAVGTARRSGGA